MFSLRMSVPLAQRIGAMCDFAFQVAELERAGWRLRDGRMEVATAAEDAAVPVGCLRMEAILLGPGEG